MESPITGKWEIADFERRFKQFFKKLELSSSSVIYFGASFRPSMELSMSSNTMIGTNVLLLVSSLTMREGSQVNAGTIITGRKNVVLGKNSVVGYGVKLFTSSDTPESVFMNDASPEEDRALKHDSIVIGENVFIGSNSIIMPGVRIGNGVCVRAQSYIDKDLDEEFSVYGENGKYFGPRPKNRKSVVP